MITKILTPLLFCLQLTIGTAFDMPGMGGIETSGSAPAPQTEETTASDVGCDFIEQGSSEYERLLALTESSSLEGTDVEELEARLQEIRSIFVSSQDRRGIFTTIYRVVSTAGLEAVQSGRFEDEAATRRLIVEFGKTYLEALHQHLSTGRSRDHRKWGRYYEQALDCEVNPLRVMATGMNTHIVLDLTDAIVRARLTPDFWDDYMALGSGLVSAIPQVAVAMEEDWGVPAEKTDGFVHSWWAGEGVNWTVDAASSAWESVSSGASRAWDWASSFFRDEDEIEEEASEQQLELTEDAASDPMGSLSMHSLRIFAWWQARRQSPSMEAHYRPAEGGHPWARTRTAENRYYVVPDEIPEPEETWTMRRMWDAVEFFFQRIIAIPLDD